jgi:dienelactone hydrolase
MKFFSMLLPVIFLLFVIGCGDDDDASSDDDQGLDDSTDDSSATDDISDDSTSDDAATDDTAADDSAPDDTTGDDAADDTTDDTSDDDIEPPPLGEYYPPDAWGPYEVGVTTTYFVDNDRFEIWGLRPRELPVEIWYPSTGEGGQVNTLGDMIGPMPDWSIGIFHQYYGDAFDTLIAVETDAMRDAEVLDLGFPSPVILFSHGLSAIRFQNYQLCEQLASHGFIVVAPDHYGNAVFTNLHGNPIIINPLSIVSSYFARTDDVEFLYNEFESFNRDDARFAGRLDLSRFGMTGHSYGGLAALNAVPHFDFIDSVAPFNPAWIPIFSPDYFDIPMFVVQSELDNIVPAFIPLVTQLYEDAPSANKVSVNMLRAGHYSMTDACVLLPPGYISPSTTGCGEPTMIDNQHAIELLDAYLTAFFKITLWDDPRYTDFLLTNQDPEELEMTYDWQ